MPTKISKTEANIRAALLQHGVAPTDQLVAALLAAAMPERELTDLQKMTNVMLEVSRWPTAKYPRALKAAQAMLKEGYTPEEVQLHYGFKDPGAGQWWWRRPGTDFRNRGNADPTPDIILETCKKWEASPVMVPQPLHAQPLQYKL